MLHWLSSLDPRGTEWPAKIKARFSTPLIESHTLDFWRVFVSWSSNPKANLSEHAELKWIYPAAPRTCRFRVIEVGVRCFESIPVFLAFPLHVEISLFIDAFMYIVIADVDMFSPICLVRSLEQSWSQWICCPDYHHRSWSAIHESQFLQRDWSSTWLDDSNLRLPCTQPR